jgi:hypothetical protein
VDASQRAESTPNAGSGSSRWFAGVAAVVAVLAVMLAACSAGGSASNAGKSGATDGATAVTSGSGGGSAQNVATEPEGPYAAIAAYLDGQGIEYVGDCAGAELPRDEGAWCSVSTSSDPAAGTATYDIGPVGEKPEKAITVKRRGATQLTPGYQVGVGEGEVGQPRQLTREELQSNTFITGNLVLDQQAGIGAGLLDLPAGASSGESGGTGGTGGGGGGTPTTPVGVTEQYPPNGEIVVETPTVEVGGEAVFRGSGCMAEEVLQISFDGQPMGTITSDPSGGFAGSIVIPVGTAPGAHRLHVQGTGCSFGATLDVAGNLAFTGSSSHTDTSVYVGLAAVVIGAILVVGSRRRRKGPRGRFGSSPVS